MQRMILPHGQSGPITSRHNVWAFLTARLTAGWDGCPGESSGARAIGWLNEQRIPYRVDANQTVCGFEDSWITMTFAIVLDEIDAVALRMVVPELIPAGYTD